MWLLMTLLLALSLTTATASPSPSPSPSSRVAIVGAGPAGLHMAYLLQRLNFSSVVILEGDSRVGGRTATVDDGGGLVHELGVCYVNSEYQELQRVAEWSGYSYEVATLPEAKLLKSDGDELTLKKFLVDQVVELLQLPEQTEFELVLQLVKSAIEKYTRVRATIFPTGEAEFPLTETPLNSTIDQFLRQHSLLPLRPLFLLGMTSMGYGHPADTPAEYGLMWMTPNYLADLTMSRENSSLGMLKRGFQPIWDSLSRNLAAEVKLNASVTSVIRQSDTVSVSLSDGSSRTFDWLIWTPNLASTSGLFKDLEEEEKDVFGSLVGRQFRTRLLDFKEKPPTPGAVVYFLENLLSNSPNLASLWAARNSGVALGLPGQSRSLVTYFLSDFGHTESASLPGGRVRLERLFHFQPRFSTESIGGIWRLLLRLQGRRRVWFAGHSVVFDSVKSVMKYNKMLLQLAYPALSDAIGDM